MEGDDHTITYTYDRYGRLSTITDPNGNQRKYTYNTNGYLLSYAFDNNKEFYSHNKYGDLTAKSYYPEGLLEHATYTYDNHRQLTAVSGPGFNESTTYNAAGQARTRTRSVTVNGATHTRTATYTYNGERRIASVSNTLDSVSVPLVETDTYQRGWLVDRSLNGTSVWQLHGEEGQGRPAWVSDQLAQRQLVYDTAGNLLAHRIAFSLPDNHTLLAHTYTYDTHNRLTSMDGKAYGYDSYNQLVSWNGHGYSFDAKGNIEVEGAQSSVTYNNYRLWSVAVPEPDVWGSNTLSVHYNGWNKPFYMNQNGDDPNHAGEAFFYYDCEGNRTGMVVNKYTSTIFPYDTELLYQRSYVDSRYETNTDSQGATTRYYYIGGDALEAQAVAVIDGSGMRVKQIYRDIQGSILELADSTAVEHYHYTPWGQYCDEDGNTDAACYHRYGDAGHPFYRGFLGQEHLLYFGLVNLNARLYDPFIGRFLTPDPVYDAERAITGFNPYAYGYNNPAVYSDPSGEYILIDDLIAAAVGGTVNLLVNAFQGNLGGHGLLGGIGRGVAAFAAGAVSGDLALYGPVGWGVGGMITGGTNAWLSGATNFDGILEGAIWGSVSSIIGGAFGQWAGKSITSVVVNGFNVTSPMIKSFISGSLGGGIGGYASGFLTGFITTRNLDFANESGLKGLKSGLFIGGITGALSGYFSAKQSGTNPWTGKIKNSITIGEGMKSDIKQGWFGIDKISKDLGTNKFDPQSRDHHGLMSENQFWIDYYMDNGAVVFDRGTVGNNSQYYFMEQQHIEGYPNVYTVKYYYNKNQSLRIYWIRKR